MYWLGFGHGVIAAFFAMFVALALLGIFGMRTIRRLAAANRKRNQVAKYDQTLTPAAAAAALSSKLKGS